VVPRENIRGISDSLYLAYDSFKVKDVEVLAINNKVQLENIKLTEGLRTSLPTETLVNAII
jgi:phosphate acetyltransferase